MTRDSATLASQVTAKISSLYEQREKYLTAITEIDAKLAKALNALGLDPADAGAPALARLEASRPLNVSYPLDPNTIGGAMVEILLKADHGYSRVEMRKELEKTEKFRAQISRNINGYYNTISRYLQKGRMVDVNGLLYHPERAPLEQGQDDPTGQHLPSSVITLFPEKAAGGADD